MLLYLKVKPNQRLNRVERIEDMWQVRLAAPAIDGKANDALVAYLSECLDLPKTKIRLVKGHTARIKALEVDAEEQRVTERLMSVVQRKS